MFDASVRPIALVGGLFWCLAACTAAAGPRDLSFEGLREILLRDRPTTIAATLQLIEQHYPSYLAHHALAYHSISLHGSSAENPRALVFGHEANFMISFNGDPAQRGYGALEVMEFSPEGSYAFRAISFLAEPHNGTELIDPDEIELTTPEIQISKPNPGICTSCHDKARPKPIWEPFPIWPGLYGSVDDRLYRLVFDPQGNLRPGEASSVPGLEGPDQEKDGYIAFLENRAQNPRYRLLPLPQGLDQVAFEASPITDAALRPNLALTRLFSIQAARLIALDAGEGPDGPARLLTLAAIGCVRGDPNFRLPAALMPIMARTTAWKARFKREIAGMTKRDGDRMRDYFGGNLRLGPDEATLESEASVQPHLLAAALEQIGLNIQDYAFNNNRVASFQDGANGLFALDAMLRDAVQAQWRWDRRPSCAEILAAL